MNSKYILTDKFKIFQGIKVYRIKALKSFGDVKIGDLGGFVESEENLGFKDEDLSWIYDDCIVCKNSKIWNNVSISNNVRIWDNVDIRNNIKILNNINIWNNVKIRDNVKISDNVNISNNVRIWDNVNIWDNVKIMINVNIRDNIDIRNNVKIMINVNIRDNIDIRNNVNIWNGIDIRNYVNIRYNVNISNSANIENTTIDNSKVYTFPNLCEFNITACNDWIRIGCHKHTIEEWKEIIKNETYKSECKDYGEYLKAYKITKYSLEL